MRQMTGSGSAADIAHLARAWQLTQAGSLSPASNYPINCESKRRGDSKPQCGFAMLFCEISQAKRPNIELNQFLHRTLSRALSGNGIILKRHCRSSGASATPGGSFEFVSTNIFNKILDRMR